MLLKNTLTSKERSRFLLANLDNRVVAPKDSELLNKRRYRSLKKRRPSGGYLPCLILVLLMLWWGYKEIKHHLVPPQAILVLGGSEQRERFAADLARQNPDLPIWISGGSPRSYTYKIFAKADIGRDRLHLDYQAVDTVTNFTTLVDEFQTLGIKKLYLITSDYHMRRAQIIGQIVLGSRGIEFIPIAVPSERSPEPINKVVRDGARAMLWVVSGHTGSTLFKQLEPGNK